MPAWWKPLARSWSIRGVKIMKNTNQIFLTAITSDAYMLGALTLKRSLDMTGTPYPFAVMITANVSERIREIMQAFDITLIEVENKVEIPQEITEANKKIGLAHWNNTFSKLCMFELTQYDKIVYLDADMVVLENIDELFLKPHVSAVAAGKSYPDNARMKWSETLNSGTVVFVPQAGLLPEFQRALHEVIRQKGNFAFGDQDVIQEYFKEWATDKRLELDERYNIFFSHLEFYVEKVGYTVNGNGEKRVAVVHFTGSIKPWMRVGWQKFRLYFKLFKHRDFNRMNVLRRYYRILGDVRAECAVIGRTP